MMTSSSRSAVSCALASVSSTPDRASPRLSPAHPVHAHSPFSSCQTFQPRAIPTSTAGSLLPVVDLGTSSLTSSGPVRWNVPSQRPWSLCFGLSGERGLGVRRSRSCSVDRTSISIAPPKPRNARDPQLSDGSRRSEGQGVRPSRESPRFTSARAFRLSLELPASGRSTGWRARRSYPRAYSSAARGSNSYAMNRWSPTTWASWPGSMTYASPARSSASDPSSGSRVGSRPAQTRRV